MDSAFHGDFRLAKVERRRKGLKGDKAHVFVQEVKLLAKREVLNLFCSVKFYWVTLIENS